MGMKGDRMEMKGFLILSGFKAMCVIKHFVFNFRKVCSFYSLSGEMHMKVRRGAHLFSLLYQSEERMTI